MTDQTPVIPADVKMQPVSHSSNVEAVGYDDKASDLYVQFKGGGTYRYSEVPRDVWMELQHAPSAGKYLNANIKAKYKSERLDKPAQGAA